VIGSQFDLLFLIFFIYLILMAFVFQFQVTNHSFENALNAAKFAVQRNRNKLGTVPDRTE